MLLTPLDDPVIRFLSDNLDGIDSPLIAAFEKDASGNPTSSRTPGVHLSSIIHSLYARVESKPLDEPVDAEERTAISSKMAVGIAWEYILSWAIGKVFPQDRIISPGGLEEDGVHMTPDRFDVVDNLVEEWKATWKSQKAAKTAGDLEKNFWWWFVQIKAYCRVLQVRQARLRILFVNSYYAPPKPRPQTWFMEFSQQELDKNWALILSHGKEIGLLK